MSGMIPSSSSQVPNFDWMSDEIVLEEVNEADQIEVKQVDQKMNKLIDQCFKSSNELIAEADAIYSEYYEANKADTPQVRIFITFVNSLYNDLDRYDSILEAAGFEKPQEWSEERLNYESINFRELLDYVSEGKKAAIAHDFKMLADAAAKALGRQLEDLMPNDSEDAACVHEAWKKLRKEVHLRDIKKLNLSNLKLLTLPPEIGQLIGLEELVVSHNQIITLPKEIGLLKHLKKLILSDNAIKIIPKELLKLKELHELDLTNNPIEKLPENLRQLGSLKIIM